MNTSRLLVLGGASSLNSKTLAVVTLQDAEWEHMRASNKIRFIQAVIKGTLVISNRWAGRGPPIPAPQVAVFGQLGSCKLWKGCGHAGR